MGKGLLALLATFWIFLSACSNDGPGKFSRYDYKGLLEIDSTQVDSVDFSSKARDIGAAGDINTFAIWDKKGNKTIFYDDLRSDLVLEEVSVNGKKYDNSTEVGGAVLAQAQQRFYFLYEKKLVPHVDSLYNAQVNNTIGDMR
ncbi:hypothetical protein ACFLZJ_01395 [Nanoarchaeota archaeon]